MPAKQISFSDLPDGLTERGKNLAILLAVNSELDVEYQSIFNAVRYFKQNDPLFAIALAENADHNGIADTNTLYGGALPLKDADAYFALHDRSGELLNRANLARKAAETFEKQGFEVKSKNTYRKAIGFYEEVGGFGIAAQLAEKIGDPREEIYRSVLELFEGACNKK